MSTTTTTRQAAISATTTATPTRGREAQAVVRHQKLPLFQLVQKLQRFCGAPCFGIEKLLVHLLNMP